jgi:hypothetical protein
VSFELQLKILGLLYEQWFKDYIAGVSVQHLVSKLGREENDISQSLEILESGALAQKNKTGSYIITDYGIDTYEENLAPSVISRKKQERRMILETLLQLYNQDIHLWMNSEELMKSVGNNDLRYVLGVVVYLEQKGFVRLQKDIGGSFDIILDAPGFQSLQDITEDNAAVMGNAYKILFIVENRLRRFIELKMRSKYGPDWWNEYVSDKIKKKVDEMRQAELDLGWRISQTTGNAEYLLFDHLEKLITVNWKNFESVFQDQPKIALRLRELEGIRNSIAHTRRLSQDGLIRLEQYSQDLLNMIGNR